MTEWLDRLPLPGFFGATMLIILVSVECGYLMGIWRSRRSEGQGENVIGSAVGAMLGLLAFILAFTFGTTASRFDTRKQLLLNEVNAIGTAALRAELLPEPHRTKCRDLIRHYVKLRVQATKMDVVPRLIVESEKTLDQLWVETTALPEADMDPPLRALFVQSVNEMIDLHTSRVTVALYNRIPGSVWLWLVGAVACTMFAVGYQFGFSQQRKILIHLLLAALLSSVVLLIADLDRGGAGSVKVNMQAMINLSNKLNGPGDSARQ